jgi:hypothetical protein
MSLQRLRKISTVGAAVVTATAMGGCNPEDIFGYPHLAYGVPPIDEQCINGYDDDEDGFADCDDSDCAGLELCLGCFDGTDNDGDGNADCSDWSCMDSEACLGCDDGLDNDNDGPIDCDDPDCAGSEACP